MSNIIPYKEDKTPYKPEYCELLLQYAYENINIDGFYGEYMILPEVAAKWEEKHEEWRDAVRMAEFRCQAGLNRNLKGLLDFASGLQIDPATGISKQVRAPDIDLLQKTIFRMADLSFRMDKDTGMLKRKGSEKAKRAKSNNPLDNNNHSLASEIAEELLNKGKDMI